jgi:hypothetical protein
VDKASKVAQASATSALFREAAMAEAAARPAARWRDGTGPLGGLDDNAAR